MEDRIYIFDVDDTLIDTRACIRAIDKSGQIIFRAGTKVFNNPRNAEQLLTPGLQWDFTEFESYEQISSEPKLRAFNILVAATSNPHNKIYIVTARQKQMMLYKWLRANGVRIKLQNICCYDRNSHNTVAEFKAEVLQGIYKDYPTSDVYIYEDDEANIEAMKSASSGHRLFINPYPHIQTSL